MRGEECCFRFREQSWSSSRADSHLPYCRPTAALLQRTRGTMVARGSCRFLSGFNWGSGLLFDLFWLICLCLK